MFKELWESSLKLVTTSHTTNTVHRYAITSIHMLMPMRFFLNGFVTYQTFYLPFKHHLDVDENKWSHVLDFILCSWDISVGYPAKFPIFRCKPEGGTYWLKRACCLQFC